MDSASVVPAVMVSFSPSTGGLGRWDSVPDST